MSCVEAAKLPRVSKQHRSKSSCFETKFCRINVYLRDGFKCQYCGEQFERQDLTFEHVIPRANGGTTCWENILAACISCNTKKRDQHANWSGRRGSGMRPLKEPRQPMRMELLRAGLKFLDPIVRETYHDYLYWSSDLKRNFFA